MRYLTAIAAILVALLIQISAVHSEPVPDLRTAIQAWLDYDDEKAIPILSRLAHSGNEDAMILLGQISLRPGLSPYLLSLGRKKRNRLLKAKGGISGKNWLRMVRKQRPLAEALYNTTLTGKRFEAVETLLELNEFDQAARTLIILSNNGEFEKIIYLSMRREFPQNMRFLLYSSAMLSRPKKMPFLSRIQRSSLLKEANKAVKSNSFQGLLFLGIVRQYIRDKHTLGAEFRIGKILRGGGMGFYSKMEYAPDYIYSGFGKDNPKKEKQKEWEQAYTRATDIVLTSKETKPLIDFCEKRCPSNVNACVKFMYGAGTGFAGLMGYQTPVSKLVSPSKYYGSKRFGSDLLGVTVKHHFDFWKDRRPKEINKCVASLFPVKQ